MADAKRGRGSSDRGAAGSSRPRTAGPGRRGAGAGAADAPSAEPAGAAHEAGVCPVAFCPICAAVSTVNRASPDVVEHLLLAGQQFLLALKAVLDARAADFNRDGAGNDEPPSMQRIDIG